MLPFLTIYGEYNAGCLKKMDPISLPSSEQLRLEAVGALGEISSAH